MRTGENNPNWRGGKTIKYCIDCNRRVCRNNKGGRCKSCSKSGKLNTFYGKNHTEKTRKKMVVSQSKRDKATYKGIAIPFDVLSQLMKKRWANASEEQRERLIKPFIAAGLKAHKKSAKTKIENIVNDILLKNGIEFIRNKQLGVYNVDFLIGSKAIECLGDYWHCNPRIYKPDYYNKSIKCLASEKWVKDRVRKGRIEDKGVIVLMLWEWDIKNQQEIIEKEILNFLKNG